MLLPLKAKMVVVAAFHFEIQYVNKTSTPM
jgi:hypothetical protein